MTDDFLKELANKSKDILGNEIKNSPYKMTKEPSKTAQIRLDTYKKVKLIAFESDRKVVDVLEDLLQIGLHDEKYSKYLK